MPLARRRPLTYAANFDPSGWKAAVPSPETITHATTSPYEGATPASAIPMPPAATPAGISQIAPCRSDQRPKSGWTTDPEIAAQSTSTAASVYERSNSSWRYGIITYSAPPAKSTAQWPLESAAIARPSIRSLTRPAYR